MEPHNMEFIKTLLIACIPALISGAISFLVAKSHLLYFLQNHDNIFYDLYFLLQH